MVVKCMLHALYMLDECSLQVILGHACPARNLVHLFTMHVQHTCLIGIMFLWQETCMLVNVTCRLIVAITACYILFM